MRPYPCEVGTVVLDGDDVFARVVHVHARTWGPQKGRVQSVTTSRRLVWKRGKTLPLVLVWTPHGWTCRWGAKKRVLRIV